MSDACALGEAVDQLWMTIEDRRTADPAVSYTAQLLTGPEDTLLKKIAEEAGEVIMASKDADGDHLCHEAADLTYHLLVVLARWGVTPNHVAEELASRFKK